MKQSLQIKRDFLKNALALSGMRSKTVYQLAHRTEERFAKPGETIVEQGSATAGMTIIRAGEILVNRVVSLENPMGLVTFPHTRSINPETEVELKLAVILPENAFGTTVEGSFRFRLIAGSKPVVYYFIPLAVLRENLDCTEMSRVRGHLEERNAEFGEYLSRNIFFRQLMEKVSQPDLIGKRIKFCRKPIFPAPFSLSSPCSLPKVATKYTLTAYNPRSRLDLLPLDFMSRHRATSQSQKQVRVDSINVRLVRKSIDKLHSLAKNPHQKLKSRFLDFLEGPGSEVLRDPTKDPLRDLLRDTQKPSIF
jgi:hypothetical protein